MNHQKDSKLLHRVPLDPVNNLMGRLDIHITRYLRVNRRKTFGWPVVMDDQVMAAQNAVIAFHEIRDLPVQFRIHRLPNQRLQRILRNPDTSPHNQQRDHQSHIAVDIDI